MAFVTPLIYPRPASHTNSSACSFLCHPCPNPLVSPPSTSPRRVYAPAHRACPRASAAESDAKAATKSASAVAQFISDAGGLGTVRFVTVGDGSILETIGRLDYAMKPFSIPGRGDYVTLASDDGTFECHLNVSAVRRITLSDEKSKVGDHTLHVIRFLKDGGKIALSVLLMWDPSRGPGHYLHGAVDAFRALQEQYGGEFTIEE